MRTVGRGFPQKGNNDTAGVIHSLNPLPSALITGRNVGGGGGGGGGWEGGLIFTAQYQRPAGVDRRSMPDSARCRVIIFLFQFREGGREIETQREGVGKRRQRYRDTDRRGGETETEI